MSMIGFDSFALVQVRGMGWHRVLRAFSRVTHQVNLSIRWAREWIGSVVLGRVIVLGLEMGAMESLDRRWMGAGELRSLGFRVSPLVRTFLLRTGYHFHESQQTRSPAGL